MVPGTDAEAGGLPWGGGGWGCSPTPSQCTSGPHPPPTPPQKPNRKPSPPSPISRALRGSSQEPGLPLGRDPVIGVRAGERGRILRLDTQIWGAGGGQGPRLRGTRPGEFLPLSAAGGVRYGQEKGVSFQRLTAKELLFKEAGGSQRSVIHSILCPFHIFRAAEQFGAASGTGREGGGAPPRRSQRCGAGSTTAAPPSQIPGLRPRPLAARSASPRFTTSPAANGPIGGRDERTSANQGLLTQVSLHPLPRPRLESHRPAVSPSHPAPLRGGGSQLRSSPGCSGGAGRGGGVCHLVTLILASSQTRLSSLSQSSW